MAQYTTELRTICSVLNGETEPVGYDDIDDLIIQSVDKIFNPNIVIYDEETTTKFKRRFIEHYFFREIGFETVSAWKFAVNRKLKLIKPKYDELYKTVNTNIDFLHDVELEDTTRTTRDDNRDITDLTNRSGNNTTNETGSVNGGSNSRKQNTENRERNRTNHSEDKFSDTPQGGLDIQDITEGTSSGLGYLTELRVIDGNDDETEETTNNETNTETNQQSSQNQTVSSHAENINHGIKNVGNTVEAITHHISGKRGTDSYGLLLQRWREQILNVTEQLVEEFEPLFMSIW